MFMKLNQHSTGWWVCAAITCVFSASLLTILIYPVYAHNHETVCRRDLCAGGCGPCDAGGDGLGADGWYEIESRVTGYSHWEDDDQCWGRVSTYHHTDIKNWSGDDVDIEWKYLALFRRPGPSAGRDACSMWPDQPPTNRGEFTVEHGQRRTNTYTQSQTYRFGLPESGCEYEAHAVTEVTFLATSQSADTQDTDEKFTGCE